MKKIVFFLIFYIGIAGWLIGQQPNNLQNRINYVSVSRVIVPPLIGKDVEAAIQLIDSVGLTRGNITNIQGVQPPGTVIRQFPAAGQIAD
jgi:hypothetical protein